MKHLKHVFSASLLILIGYFIFQGFVPNKINNFVIVIPSYNNEQWYKNNLNSVFSQTYFNYRVIYIDDCSSDGTYSLVKDYLEKNNKTEKVILIKNNKRCGALANHYKAIHMCKDDEIIVCLDGDDWFANDNVLKYLNKIYQDPKIWLTYGQFANWPTGQLGWCEEIPKDIVKQNKFREFGFVSPQLRTYYAWLAKKVKFEDLLYKNKDGKLDFFPIAGDVALMFPMLEMAAFHFKFIPKILCQRNVATELNDFKVNPDLQIEVTNFIRSKKPYKRLEIS
ncbi:glycosyltransferase family 2 protein [Candidatus Dependentiae bacterium]|nr:glycosyltransferase family 2 protein [Candidatus Dependentiae bacterium]